MRDKRMTDKLDLPPPAEKADVLWFLPTHGDGRYLGSEIGARHVSLGYLSQIELGKNSASIETLYRICLGLGLKIADLFNAVQMPS